MTKKPRITVTLTEHQHRLLTAISESSGQSMSGIVGELLEVSVPTFERMAITFQKLRQATDFDRQRMVDAMTSAQDALEPIARSAVDQWDLFLGKVEGAVRDEGDPARGDASSCTAPADAPPTNRGATPSPATTPKTRRGKALRAFSSEVVLKKNTA